MMIVNEKIGMYTEDEILEHLTEGEGRGFLGRSMYDAIFDKIHALKTENEQLQQENARLKEQLLVAQTNEETFRLEMEDITKTLGLDEDTLFDDVKAYARSLKDNWNKLEEYIKTEIPEDVFIDTEWYVSILDKMHELEESGSNE